ncbi:MAG: thioredoxin domain-containing protein [Candidatus Omnitrophica bacterium]|nr:thioredoxin domain-containing protein [Candidatus Omnitrophota bacterium]
MSATPQPATATAPARLAFAWLFILAVLGVALAGYLLLLPAFALQGGSAFGRLCTPSGHFDCFTVSASRYGTLYGLPLSAWAIILYALVALLALVGLGGEAPLAVPALAGIGALAFFAVLVDGYLAWIMVTKIRYLCSFCLATYAVNGLLFVSAMVAGRGRQITAWHRLWQLRGLVPGSSWARAFQAPQNGLAPLVQALFAFAAVLAVGSTLGIAWFVKMQTAGDTQALHSQLRTYIQSRQAVVVDTTGDPVQGPDAAPVTLVEFSDFLCPSCQTFFVSHRVLRTNEPERVRLIFKHYPLDQACNDFIQNTTHPGACRYAIGAECAQRQGKFWTYYDGVFEEARRITPQPLDVQRLEQILPRMGLNLPAWRQCVGDPTALQAVKRDIETAHRLGVTSTPSLFINGVVFAGALPPSVLEESVRLLEGTPGARRR